MRTFQYQYEAVLRELDKYGSPSYLVEDHNYWWNKAKIQYVNKRYTLFETKQQLVDDLRILIALQDVNVGTLALNSDYLHLLNCIVTTSRVIAGCETPSVISTGAKRLTHDAEARVLRSYFHQPSPRRAYYQVVGNNLRIFVGTQVGVTVTSVKITYLKTPSNEVLSNDLSNGSTSGEFEDYVVNEVVNECVKLFLENIKEPRIQTFPTTTQSIL